MTRDRSGGVLQVGPLKESLTRTLREKYAALTLPDDGRDAFLAEHAGTVRVAVTSGRTGVDTDLMSRLPGLRAIVNFGVGYDTTDVAAAAARGIAVSHTPDVLTDCVADLALSLVLDVLRRTTAADRFVRSGQWAAGRSFPLARRMSGSVVGIVGLGRIGRAIAARAAAFGCQLRYYGRREQPDVPYRYVADLRELAAGVDVLVVAAAGGAGTRGLVDRAVLTALGPEGYLVNIARGSIVDEEALVELLAQGRLAGAGLDVFGAEPHVPAELLDRDDVVLLPHIGSATVQTRDAMERLVLDNLNRFLADGTLVTPVPEAQP